MTDKYERLARNIAHMFRTRCTGGTGHGYGGDAPRYHSAKCDELTNMIRDTYKQGRIDEREKIHNPSPETIAAMAKAYFEVFYADTRIQWNEDDVKKDHKFFNAIRAATKALADCLEVK